MDFQFSKEEERLRRDIREFAKENLPDHHIGHILDEEHSREAWAFSMTISKKLAEKKWLTLSWPVEFGGLAASEVIKTIFSEEVGYWGIPGTTMGQAGTSWVAPSLMLFGSRAQQEKYIPPIASGSEDGIWCTGYSEPDAGTDMASMETFAERVGDEYILNGQKVWTSCAHFAKWLWLACRTDRNVEKKHHGLSLFIVDMESDGLTVNPLINMVGGHVFNELFFKDVRIPAENLVGVENQGWSQLMTALSFERRIAAGVTGIARRLFDELLEYTRASGLISQARVRSKLAGLAIDINCLRLLSYETAWKADQGMTVIHEPSRNKAAGDVLMEKLARIGADILGSYSQVDVMQKESKWTKLQGAFEHLYYYCIGMAIAAGTTDTQRNIVGQFGLQLPRSY